VSGPAEYTCESVAGREANHYSPAPYGPTMGQRRVVSMTSDSTLCGWRIRSEWPLPELLPWTGDDRVPDISIRLGEVPECLPGNPQGGPVCQVNEEGLVRYAIRDVAAYLIREGKEIVIATRLPHGAPDVGLFLLGSVFGIVCHQRGVLPLHASCIAFGDRAVAFAGVSGSGKSTIAAALLALGGLLVSDDVTVVDIRAEGGPMALPSFPRQKLWRDTLDALAIPPGRPLRSIVDLQKFERPVADRFRTEPVRLAMICHLRPSVIRNAMDTEKLRGAKALKFLQNNIYRYRVAELLDLSSRQFIHVGKLAASVPQQRLFVGNELHQLLDAMVGLPSALGLVS